MKLSIVSTFAKALCLVAILACGRSASAQTAGDTLGVAAQPQTPQSASQPAPTALIMGKVSTGTILPRMPQYIAMQESLKSLKEQYEAEAKKSESDFQRKFEEFMQGQKDFPKTILEKRQNELQMMLETNVEFRIKAQKLLAEAERSMLADVKAELAEAIAAVAQENGIGIVFDMDGDSVPYVMPNLALDITEAVLQYLGIGAEPQGDAQPQQ